MLRVLTESTGWRPGSASQGCALAAGPNWEDRGPDLTEATCCRRSLSFLARRSHHLLLSLLPLNPDDAKAKAAKAAKTVKKNTHTKKRRVRTSVVFHRPRTLQLGRTPKFPRQR
jgi:hypothetical protein